LMKKTSLVIRAPNWIGDAVYCLPTWERLGEKYELHIVGKGWLLSLLKGYPQWHTHKLASGFWQRVKQYKNIRLHLNHADTGVNALVFPSSLGSVADMRLAGLRVLGHRHEGRAIFLKQSLPMPDRFSSIYKRYWDLGDAFLQVTEPVPEQIHFHVDAQSERSAIAILEREGLSAKGYIVACPFAGGNFEGKNKKWPHFSQWAELMQARGFKLICCPSPSEEAEWSRAYSNIFALKGLDLAQYAAVLKNALCVVANDTGPGHMAAATGVPLVSVLNETIFEMYGAVGHQVSVVQSKPDWPTANQVLVHTIERISRL
jgi:heptosyltransferase-2